MHRFHMIVAVGAFVLSSSAAEPEKKDVDPKLLEPKAEQIAAAKQEYFKHGAFHIVSKDPAMKNRYLTVHRFGFAEDVTDADLKGLPDLPFYFAVSFRSKITDKGLKELKDLKNLTFLNLSETAVTDTGMAELKGLKNLRYLNLQYTTITDKGLKELKELKNLRDLILHTAANIDTPQGLTETPVTEEGIAELKKALPQCHMYHRYH